MQDEDTTRLVDGYLSMDPIIMYYIYESFRQIRLNFGKFDWVKNYDYADMFFSAYQDALSVSSEKELIKIFSPHYYKAFYNEFLEQITLPNIQNILSKNDISLSKFNAQIDKLCEIAPKIAVLRPAFLIASNIKNNFDEKQLSISLNDCSDEYNEILNLILYILTCCGGLARMFFAEKVSMNIEDSGSFRDFIEKFLKHDGAFTSGPDKLFPTYNKYYYDILKIDDNILFRCAITIYSNQFILKNKSQAKSLIKTKSELKQRLDEWFMNAENKAMLLNKIEGGILEELRKMNIAKPQVFIYGLYYAGVLFDDYERKWKRKLGR